MAYDSKTNVEIEGFRFTPEVILRLVGLIHIFTAPLTKVEESFNLQATHDILFHRWDIDKYDHLEYPGVVPRTFIGPLIVAFLSGPFVFISQFSYSKFAGQLIVRVCLSEIVLRGFQKFRISISKEFGESFGLWLVMITASQFHLMFYLGRTLPNIYAMPAALMALHCWIARRHKMLIFLAAFDSAVFRSELAMLFGIILLFELYHKRISLWQCLKYGIPSSIVSIAATVLIDSFFWKRWLWPEGEVFYFNTVLNQSHKWGTQPFLWYFYSALPRAMGASVLLVPYGLYINRRVRTVIAPCYLFVLLFSFLPHKELRFIFYVIPMFNVAAAATCDKLWKNRGKSFMHALIAVGVIFHVVLNGVFSTGSLIISSKNYPGGNALLKLHEVEPLSAEVNVHIDVYAAQTGVSRFLEVSPVWKYNKSENLLPGSPEMLDFTHLVVHAADIEQRYIYFKTHENLLSVTGYTGIDVNVNRFPPIKIKTDTLVLVLRKFNKPKESSE